MKTPTSAILLVAVCLASIGCGGDWQRYVDIAISMEAQRREAEALARAVKASTTPGSAPYEQSRMLYQEARRTNYRLFLTLAQAMSSRAKIQSVESAVLQSEEAASRFHDFSREALLSLAQANGARGGLLSIAKSLIVPFRSAISAKLERHPTVAEIVTTIEGVVIWPSWEAIR